MAKKLKFVVLAFVILLAGSQFIQPDRSNPPINPAATFEAVAKPSAELTAVVSRACYNCHSNNTIWPWYSRIAPVSWLVADDVKGGRAHLNFSEWGLLGPDVAQRRLQDVCDEVRAGDMPLWQYRLMRPEARLSAQDVKVLCSTTAR
jgi:hypothetical protein